MARNPQKVHELAIQIKGLDPDDRMELLRLVASPDDDEFFRLIEGFHEKNRAFAARTIAREVNLAVREVRAKRTSS